MRMIALLLAATLTTLPALAQDAAKEAALDRFMKAINVEGGYTALGGSVLQSFAPLVLMNQDKQKVVEDIIKSELVPELKNNRPIYTKALRAAYAKRFNTAELNSASMFIESPLGQKIRVSERDVQGEAFQALTPMQKKIQTVIAPQVLKKMKAAGLNIPPSKP